MPGGVRGGVKVSKGVKRGVPGVKGSLGDPRGLRGVSEVYQGLKESPGIYNKKPPCSLRSLWGLIKNTFLFQLADPPLWQLNRCLQSVCLDLSENLVSLSCENHQFKIKVL